jgi:hypothetical protein
VVEDSDGNVVLRDRGRLTFRALFDTLGDGEPGGELLEQELTSQPGRIRASSPTSARSPPS